MTTQAAKIIDYTLEYIEEGWRSKLEPFINSKWFKEIVLTLAKDENRPITPAAKIWFRAFRECPYKELKVVLMAQDAYYQKGVADGLAFSCSNTGVQQPSLKYIYKEIKETVPMWDEGEFTDLGHWAKQGVLLFNASLTTREGFAGSHIKIWRPFTDFIFEVLGNYPDPLIFCLWGREAQVFEGHINPLLHEIIKAEHPAAPAYRKAEKWDSNGSFTKISDYLQKHKKRQVIW